MFGTERNLDMIKKKVSKIKVKAKTKSKVKSKIKAKKVVKKVSKKIKNPVYPKFDYLFQKAFDKYTTLGYMLDQFVNIHSNIGIISGVLTAKNPKAQGFTTATILSVGEQGLDFLNANLYILKTNFHQMPNRDDLSLIAENDDYLGNDLFWNEHDEFKKDSFKKSTDYQFILGNVDKVDIEHNRIYVRRLKQVRSK